MGHNLHDELEPILEELIDLEWQFETELNNSEGILPSPTYETFVELIVDTAHSYSLSLVSVSNSTDTAMAGKKKGRKRQSNVKNPQNAARCRQHREDTKKRFESLKEEISVLRLKDEELRNDLEYRQNELNKGIEIMTELMMNGSLGILS